VTQGFGCTFGVLKQPWLTKTLEVRRKLWARRKRVGAIAKTLHIRTTSALSFQPTSGMQEVMQVAEQSVMIANPVKRGSADDNVESTLEWQVQEIAGDQTQSPAEVVREMLSRGVEHVLRKIDCDDSTAWKGVQQFGGESSGSATCIENDFLTAKLEASENLLAPTDLRSGKAMVNGGVPLTRSCFLVTHEIQNLGDG